MSFPSLSGFDSMIREATWCTRVNSAPVRSVDDVAGAGLEIARRGIRPSVCRQPGGASRAVPQRCGQDP